MCHSCGDEMNNNDFTGLLQILIHTKMHKACGALLAIFIALLASIVGQYILVYGRWQYIDKLDRNDFAAADNIKIYSTGDIPTTFYTPGKLNEVMPKV